MICASYEEMHSLQFVFRQVCGTNACCVPNFFIKCQIFMMSFPFWVNAYATRTGFSRSTVRCTNSSFSSSFS